MPHVWRFKDIKPLIVEAGSLVPIEFAERRVLQLINPGPKRSGFTTDTLYAGIQSVLPGEVAPAHRHVAHAQRFIIQGSGATTAVEGLEYKMERGDVLLTPSFKCAHRATAGLTRAAGTTTRSARVRATISP